MCGVLRGVFPCAVGSVQWAVVEMGCPGRLRPAMVTRWAPSLEQRKRPSSETWGGEGRGFQLAFLSFHPCFCVYVCVCVCARICTHASMCVCL